MVVDPATGPDIPAAPGSAVPVIPDPRGRFGGRGAWLHPTIDCCDLAVRRRAFARALRVQAPIETRALTAYVTAYLKASEEPDCTGPAIAHD